MINVALLGLGRIGLMHGENLISHKNFNLKYTFDINKNLADKIAKKFNLDVCQMAIKFCEVQPFVTSVIIGATKNEQLKKNLESHEINLDDEVIQDINKVQEIYSNPCP